MLKRLEEVVEHRISLAVSAELATGRIERERAPNEKRSLLGRLMGTFSGSADALSEVSEDSEALRSSYRKERTELLRMQWKTVVSVIEEHRGTLAADYRRIFRKDKWGRVVGWEEWEVKKEEFAQDVLPTLVDCSLLIEDLRVLIPDAIDAVVDNAGIDDGSGRIDEMTGAEFEQLCANLLEEAGWVVMRTQASGDQGIDLVARMHGWSVAVQCKRYAQPVGNGAVQEARAGMDFYGCDAAAVVASSSFTRSAVALAASTGVRLLSPEQLASLEKW